MCWKGVEWLEEESGSGYDLFKREKETLCRFEKCYGDLKYIIKMFWFYKEKEDAHLKHSCT